MAAIAAEVTRLRGEGDCEVRWVAVPPTWETPNTNKFSVEKMQSLSDLDREHDLVVVWRWHKGAEVPAEFYKWILQALTDA